MKNKIIPYNPKLKEYARELRKNSTLAEVLMWKAIKNQALDVQFHRQVPMLNYIVDFYCHELMLAIEIDGDWYWMSFEWTSSEAFEQSSFKGVISKLTSKDKKQLIIY